MTLAAAEEALAPQVLHKAYTNAWGSGGQTFYYHLKGNLELELATGSLSRGDRVESLCPLRFKQRWFQIFWDPDPTDRRNGLAIALKELTLEKHESIRVSSGSGEWRTHRLLHLDLFNEHSWQRKITVDLDEGHVVPSLWEPTPEELNRARALTDPLHREFLKMEGKLEVRAYGEYDYGPLRRLLTIHYQMHQRVGTALSGSVVDIDAGKLLPF